MTAVTVDFSSYASLYTEKEVLAVPGEGASLNIGSVKGAALYDLDGGRTLVEENITEKLYPASMTKIMTALLAIKYGKMDQVLTASSRLAFQSKYTKPRSVISVMMSLQICLL